jgi:DUF971 family protein
VTAAHSGADRAADPWPTDIAYDAAAKCLRVSFDTGETFTLPAEYLRVESPSAEVQGHNPAERKFIGGRRHVGIIGIEQVGNYAVRLVFDDLHDTGLYSWRYLHELGHDYETRWRSYCEGLTARGLSRDP